MAAAAATLMVGDLDAIAQIGSLSGWQSSLPTVVTPNVRRVPGAPATETTAAIVTRAMPICGGGRRTYCVIDGDTFWFQGKKIRLESIDAPETRGACRYEIDLAAQATRRLSQLLSSNAISIERSGHGRFGRTLARLNTGRGEVGAILVNEGLAQRWSGRKADWC